MNYFPSHPSRSETFDRKLRACNPQRQLIQNMVGAVVFLLSVAAAVYVALTPRLWF